MAKLYPPTIENCSFYGNLILVPFTHNRAVSGSLIKSYALRIKSINNNNTILDIFGGTAIDNNVQFYLDDQDLVKLNLGLFYKVLLAYIDKNNLIGYYSTVAIVKYTTPIENSIIEVDKFLPNCFHIIVNRGNEDLNDPLYSYELDLIEAGSDKVKILASSGILYFDIINHSFNTSYLASYIFNNIYIDYENNQYYLRLKAKTANGVERIFDPYLIEFTLALLFDSNEVILNVENNFEYGYIAISTDYLNFTKGYLSRLVDNNYECIGLLYPGLTFYDFNIELGKTYTYALSKDKYYIGRDNSLLASKSIKSVRADYEDMSLWDGKRLLRLRFNPEVSSYKTTRQEQKVETLGSQYPFVFYNSILGYKEFPLSGFVATAMDEAGWFMKFPRTTYRRNSTLSYIDPKELVDSAQEMFEERVFKNEVLDWLNDGRPKLFRSPQEGTFIVNIMGVSMAPNDVLGRKMHIVSMSAVEIDDLNYENLTKYNLNNIILKQDNDEDYIVLPMNPTIINPSELGGETYLGLASNTEYGLIKGSDDESTDTIEKINITNGEIEAVSTDILSLGTEVVYIGDVDYIPKINNNIYDRLTASELNRQNLASNNNFGIIKGKGNLSVNINHGEIEEINISLLDGETANEYDENNHFATGEWIDEEGGL